MMGTDETDGDRQGISYFPRLEKMGYIGPRLIPCLAYCEWF
jgi:hypothetical protein